MSGNVSEVPLDEADADIREGRARAFDTMDDLFARDGRPSISPTR